MLTNPRETEGGGGGGGEGKGAMDKFQKEIIFKKIKKNQKK